MLVISRKSGQKLMINDNIVITIVEIRNGQCRIAIDADKDVKIYREEIYYQVKLANLVGKNSNVISADSVSDLLKNKTVKINDKVDTSATNKDEIIDDKKDTSKSIVIRKNNKLPE